LFFTVQAGSKTDTPYLGPQLLTPDNGCGCPCDAPLSFSWSPFQEITEYKFELSENSDMSKPIVSTTVSGVTSYEYEGEVRCNTNYFWRVMAIEPWPSEWSATFTFYTGKQPMAATSEEQPTTATGPLPTQSKSTPFWLWIIILIAIILMATTIVLLLLKNDEEDFT